MKTQRLLIALTLVNLALLIFTLAQMRPAVAEGVSPVLRGRALEIVDEQGRLRATLSVLPAHTQTNGERFPETVLFRLIDEHHRPDVKISASEEGSGLTLDGGASTTETYLAIGATGAVSSLKLRNEDGREKVVKP
jgi:hypothetical protein